VSQQERQQRRQLKRQQKAPDRVPQQKVQPVMPDDLGDFGPKLYSFIKTNSPSGLDITVDTQGRYFRHICNAILRVVHREGLKRLTLESLRDIQGAIM